MVADAELAASQRAIRIFTEFPRCIGTPTRVPWEASNPREARCRLKQGKAGQVPCVSMRAMFTAPLCARFTKLRIRTRRRSDRFEFTCLSRYGGVLERAFLLVSFMCLVIACVCSRPAYAGRVCRNSSVSAAGVNTFRGYRALARFARRGRRCAASPPPRRPWALRETPRRAVYVPSLSARVAGRHPSKTCGLHRWNRRRGAQSSQSVSQIR